MVTQHLIDDEWTAVSEPGKPMSFFLDEQDDGAGGSVDCRIISSIAEPSAADFTKAKRVYRPIGNTDILQMKPKSGDVED